MTIKRNISYGHLVLGLSSVGLTKILKKGNGYGFNDEANDCASIAGYQYFFSSLDG
ncbi:hypothetical protein RyT2_25410 [Pseudolactococcus yaeyamensis]